ncbi:ABC drug exporter AbcA [Lindgomyces ingoldianus]|uniref:ABC drug exporter AbcA n=1 Tax=Lindgomyces ingoldianus TaxID=673940 RepID=A0ACB6R839_9PLEO|nr:ABC drug exporter AbcA [Lindgomyces ingoldianus]KAF2475215.1 ABC drug exporter AbcA [Lindgomyces ingoldianus]
MVRKSKEVNAEVNCISSVDIISTASRLPADGDRETALCKWVKHRKEQEQLQLGLSFLNLKVHGFLSPTNYQHTFGSYVLAVPEYLRSLVGNRHDSKVQILHSMDGLVKSGEMLLVLGRPGSGCSTFLKTIAGDTHGFVVSDDSNLNYEGLSYSELHGQCKAESVYVAELDVHFPELTLGQTLAFAASARSKRSNASNYVQDSSQWVASMFNLKDAFNTPMGNDMIRGVSGGEKKRASIAEAFMGGSQIQCWDNSTRGLDSSTASDFIAILRGLADELGSTILVSVYQASEAIYKTFDKVMLLYEGRQIYFGTTASAVQYFTSMGFVKPAKVTSADFLTSLTNPSERLVAHGYELQVPRTADDFANMWKQSLERGLICRDIEEFNHQNPLNPGNLKQFLQEKSRIIGVPRALRSPYAISTMQQVAICGKRAFQRLANNSGPTISGVIGNAIIGIIVGSVFYNLGDSSASVDSRALLLFFSIMLNACTSGLEILTIWAQRPIVEKQSHYAFCQPFTEACASMICDLPNKILTSLLFNLALYFMTNLRRTPSAFFIFYLFSFAALLTMSMVFRMMGSLSKRIEQSMAPGAIMVLNFIIYTGFVVPIPYMVPWFGWIRFINPIAYAYESLMINEVSIAATVPSGPDYQGVTGTSFICPAVGARPGENFIDGTAYLWSKFRYPTNHLWRNLALMAALMVGYCAIYLLAVEYVPAERSKGEILLFKHRILQNKKMKNSIDEETNASVITLVESKRKDSALRDSTEDTPECRAVQNQTAVLHWNDVCYDVKVKKNETRRILNAVDGWVNPGSLTALMGATGAGKTTLLDVLASRVSTGIVTGDIFVDGQPRRTSFQRQTGYVQQADIHLQTSTVREALAFSAVLRQPKTRSMQEKIDYVDHVLELLEMEAYADAVVGVPGEGLNVEQRRRLSIAIEMAARPELLLFLDEPTSGLDSQTAWSICTLLRKLANNGQAVLCTIHQPSAQLFDMFDRLLLLEKGGSTLYFGDIGANGMKMVRYFEKHGARTCKYHENPAEWMLDITSATQPSENTIPWADVWYYSGERHKVKLQLKFLSDRRASITALPELPSDHSHEFATSHSIQFVQVIYRIFQEYWRTPSYLYSKVALCVGAALFNGFSFYASSNDIQGLVSIIFSIFLLTNIFTSADQQIIPRFLGGRAIFEAREMRSKTYSWTVFISSHIAIELAWQTIIAVLVFVAWYYPTGLWRNGDSSFGMNERAALAFLFIWMFCLFSSTFCQAIAAAIEHAETAVNMANLFFYLCIIFCGILVKPDDLPEFWKFMYRVSPLTYFIHGMISAGIGNTSITCSSTEVLRVMAPTNRTCGDYFSSYVISAGAGGRVMNPSSTTECLFCPVTDANTVLKGFGVNVEDRWVDFGIFVVYVVVNIVATYAFYWLARVPKAKKS